MKKLVVGMSGASGVVYGIRLLEVLQSLDVESHLVITEPAREIIGLETDYSAPRVEGLATHVHSVRNLAAPIASGSFKTDGMVVIPCSIKTLSAVATSHSENLLVRAADVTLKERRTLVLVVRETPLHQGHLRLMQLASDAGAVIYPPVPAFYFQPQSLEEIVDHAVGRILDLLHIEHDILTRWAGPSGRPSHA
ncbi:MAG TPA: UbiX family flavin prenyltransferase [Chloroflexi bacterium]|nr:UbiX family flavin prenyltransferase [Chloroflexota bacterium]